ncbi:MAG: TIGR00282 family metallophosphoesterase [Phycisphaerae bacterium]
MRLLFIGDIVGRPGKHACSQLVPRLIRQRELACVIANSENAAAGSGLTPAIFGKLRHYGIDVCTMGDHIYKRRDIYSVLETSDHIVRPANLPNEALGRPFTIVQARNGVPVGVISLLGQTYMNVRADCPFHTVDRVLAGMPSDVRVVLVDMHAETTSEKIAMGWYLDGRVSAVVGTHTHVQTADERVLPGGTAFITDVGMTGPHDSVLGRDKQRVISSLVSGMPHPYDVAQDDIRLSGAVIDVDPSTGRASAIERVSQREDSPMPAMDDT